MGEDCLSFCDSWLQGGGQNPPACKALIKQVPQYVRGKNKIFRLKPPIDSGFKKFASLVSKSFSRTHPCYHPNPTIRHHPTIRHLTILFFAVLQRRRWISPKPPWSFLAAVDMSTSTPRGAQVFTKKLGVHSLEGRCFNIMYRNYLWYHLYTSYTSYRLLIANKNTWKQYNKLTNHKPYESTLTGRPNLPCCSSSIRTYPEFDLNFVLL